MTGGLSGWGARVIRVEYLPGFHFGDDVVLVALDGAGRDAFVAALDEADRRGDWRVELNERTHRFRVEAEAADVGLHSDHTEWRLDHTVIADMVDKLAAMKQAGGPSHHYVDIAGPAGTLVLSLDEYPDGV